MAHSQACELGTVTDLTQSFILSDRVDVIITRRFILALGEYNQGKWWLNFLSCHRLYSYGMDFTVLHSLNILFFYFQTQQLMVKPLIIWIRCVRAKVQDSGPPSGQPLKTLSILLSWCFLMIILCWPWALKNWILFLSNWLNLFSMLMLPFWILEETGWGCGIEQESIWIGYIMGKKKDKRKTGRD